MKKEQKKMIGGVVALILAVVTVTAAAIAVSVKNKNDNNPTTDETDPVVVDPITPSKPIESVEDEHKNQDETTDPKVEVEEESAPEIELDIAEKEIETGRKDEPGIVGDVVIQPGVKGDNE